jgi:flagellar motor component MotA
MDITINIKLNDNAKKSFLETQNKLQWIKIAFRMAIMGMDNDLIEEVVNDIINKQEENPELYISDECNFTEEQQQDI